MSRPRPRIEGRANARTAKLPVKSQAPKDARLVPQQMSTVTAPRAVAANRMLSGK